jgi:translation elongation factor P/translation initiation factor 5A
MAEPEADAPEGAEDTEPTSTATDDTEPVSAEELKKWKSLSRANEKALRAAQAELDKVKQSSMSETERAVAQAKAEGRAEAMREANTKLLHAEIRAAAASVLADPDDAVHLLDLDSFDSENIDRRQIKSALADLVKSKPYLSAAPGNGSGEGGARGDSAVALNGDPLLRDLERVVGAPRR